MLTQRFSKVYQVGRAIGALTMDEGTVDVARRHALQLIHLEQRLHIFVERPIQEWFIQHATLMRWTNRAYSFIHIPGSILFLVVFYYLTTTRPRRNAQSALPSKASPTARPALNPALYEQRRRTMAMCNLFAFVIFTCWPCMPPRLLSDPTYEGPGAKEAKGYGFVDTVHGADGESSVWTTNKFCNQYGESGPSCSLVARGEGTLRSQIRPPFTYSEADAHCQQRPCHPCTLAIRSSSASPCPPCPSSSAAGSGWR